MEDSSSQKIHRNYLKSDGQVTEFLTKFKEFLFVAFPKSLTGSLFASTGLVFSIFDFIKELQVLTIIYLRPFEPYRTNKVLDMYLKLIVRLANPSMYFAELTMLHPNTLIICTITLIWLLFGYIFLDCLLSLWSSSQSRITNNQGKIRKILFFLVSEILAFPIVFLLFSSLACTSNLTTGTSSINIFDSELMCLYNNGKVHWFGLMEIFTGILFIFFCYIIKSLNFDNRIKRHSFGCKSGNSSSAFCFVLHSVMIIAVYINLSNPRICSLLTIIINLIIFCIKSQSKDYICPSIKRIEVGVSSLTLWFFISFGSLILPNLLVTNLELIFLVSLIFLIITLIFKRSDEDLNCIGLDSARINCPDLYCKKLEKLVWLYNHNEANKNDYYSKIFYGFMANRSFGMADLDEMNSPLMEQRAARRTTEHVFKSFKLKGIQNQGEGGLRDGGGPGRRTSKYGGFGLNLEGGDFRKKLSSKMTRSQSDHMNNSYVNTMSVLFDQEIDNLPQYISMEYIEALKRFPNHVKLKLSFAYFMTDFTNMRNIALYQLSLLEEENLSIEQDLILYRLKNVMDHQELIMKERKAKIDQQDEDNSHFLSEIMEIKLNNTMNEYLERAATDYTVLWETLLDDNPKIKKVNEALKSSYKKIVSLNRFWEKNVSINLLNLNSKRFYGIFLTSVLYQKKEGDRIISEFYNYMKKSILKKYRLVNLHHKDNLGENSHPIVIFSRDNKKKIFIHNCNLQFATLLGYTKSDLLKKDQGKIVPNCCQKYYKKIFRRKGAGEVYKNTEKLNFAHKNGTLVFYEAEIKIVPESHTEKYLLIKIKSRKYSQPEGMLLVKPNGKIVGNTPGCMTIFSLNTLLLEDSAITNIADLCPSMKLRMDYSEFMDQPFNSFEYKLYLKTEKVRKKWIRKLNFAVDRMTDSNYYMFRIWVSRRGKTSRSYNKLEEDMVSSFHVKKALENLEKRFVFMINKEMQFEGVFVQDSSFDEFLHVTAIRNSKYFLSKIHNLMEEKKEMIKSEVKYGDGIRTKRLVDGMVRDVYESDEENEEFYNDASSSNSIHKFSSIFSKNRRNAGQNQDFLSSVKVRRILNLKTRKPIDQKMLNPNMERSLSTFLVLILFFLAISIIFLVSASEIQDNGFEVSIALSKANIFMGMRSSSLCSAFLRLQEITLINAGINLFQNFKGNLTMKEYKNTLFGEFKDYLADVKTFDDEISKVMLEIENESDSLNQLVKKQDIVIHFPGANDDSKQFTYSEAMSQIYSTGLSISQLSLEGVVAGNTEVEFFMVNSMTSFKTKFEEFAEALLTIRNSFNRKLPETSTLNYSVLSGMCIFFMLSFMISLSYIFGINETLVETFYGFDNKYINEVIFTTENFITIIQNNIVNEEDRVVDDEDHNTQNLKKLNKRFKEDDDYESIFKLKKKKKKGTLNPFIGSIKLWLLLLILMNSGIVFYKLFVHYSEIVDVFKIADILVDTNRVLRVTSSSQVDLQRYMIEPRKMIEEHKTLGSYVNTSKEEFKGALEAYELNLLKYNYLKDNLASEYQKIFNTDLCDVLNQIKNNSSEVTSGYLHVGYDFNCPYFFLKNSPRDFATNFVGLYSDFLKIVDTIQFLDTKKSDYDFGEKCDNNEMDLTPNTPFARNMLCLFLTESFQKMRLFNEYIVQNFFKKIGLVASQTTELSYKVNEDNENFFYVMIAGFSMVIFLISIQISLLFNYNINGAKRMITYHKLNDIKQNKKLVTYLSGVVEA